MKQVVAFAVVAALVVGQTTPALGCTVVISNEVYEPTPQEITRYRAQCLDLRTHRRANLRRAERGELTVSEVIGLAERYESTTYGCPGDEEFAFDLLAAAVPDPVPLDVDMWLLGAIDARMTASGSRLAAARQDDLRGKFWLLAGDSAWRRSYEPTGLLARAILSDPANMALALTRFGDNNSRDAALLREVSDPASPLFNRAVFAQLALQALSLEQFTAPTRQRLFQAARLMLDPQLGAPDFATARTLLLAGNIHPYDHLDAATDELAASLWQQIGQHLSQSGNPEDRAAGEALLVTGDPLSGQRTVNTALPANVRYLPEWPVQFGEISGWDRILPRIAQNYPVRAIRNAESGPVETAVHYGPDGALIGFVVLRSSGSTVLDDRAIENWSRYLRPRPPQTLPADMVSGQDLLIRMPTVEFHLAANNTETATRLPDGRIMVTALLRQPGETYSDCF